MFSELLSGVITAEGSQICMIEGGKILTGPKWPDLPVLALQPCLLPLFAMAFET